MRKGPGAPGPLPNCQVGIYPNNCLNVKNMVLIPIGMKNNANIPVGSVMIGGLFWNIVRRKRASIQ